MWICEMQCNFSIFIHSLHSKKKINKYYSIALHFTLYGTFFSSIIICNAHNLYSLINTVVALLKYFKIAAVVIAETFTITVRVSKKIFLIFTIRALIMVLMITISPNSHFSSNQRFKGVIYIALRTYPQSCAKGSKKVLIEFVNLHLCHCWFTRRPWCTCSYSAGCLLSNPNLTLHVICITLTR